MTENILSRIMPIGNSKRKGCIKMDNTQEKRERLITPEQAAERLVVSPLTIKKWLRQGKLQGVKIFGSGWRIRETEIDNLIERSEGGNNPR